MADHGAGPGTLLGGIPPRLDRFAAAHRAFVGDGVVLRIPKGKAAGRYVVELQAVTPGTVSFPHLTVEADEGSEASVAVLCRSPHGAEITVVPQIEAAIADNAFLSLTLVQAWGDQTYGVAQQRIGVGRDAHATMAEAGLGGSNARLHLTVDLEGRGADARILGVYFGEQDQTLDYRYFMNHRAPNTTSEMFLKGAVGDTASSVFTGLIRIEPEGQKTNAHQTNRNLVLSEGAEAHSVPNLEILANDVRCGHGSAVGPLDEEQRYYLMSRGLDRVRADRLQMLGFFEDVLSRFPDQSVEPPLSRLLLDKYAGIVAREAG
jgi:Fe-S cluster assembly protein SufD